MRPYQVKAESGTRRAYDPDYDEKGIASWYGEQFHNRNTANGEVFDMDRITAGPQDPAAAMHRRGHRSGHGQEDPRAGQRPRAVRQRPDHRPVQGRGQDQLGTYQGPGRRPGPGSLHRTGALDQIVHS
jgi:hypothetical protein